MRHAHLVFSLLLAAPVCAADLPSRNVAGYEPDKLTATLAQASATWWIRAGDVVYSPSFAAAGEAVDTNPANYNYIIADELSPDQPAQRVGGLGNFHILHNPLGLANEEPIHAHCLGHGAGVLTPIHSGLEWEVPATPAASPRAFSTLNNAQVQALVNQVDKDRYFNAVSTLTSFVTRETGTTGNVSARDWLSSQYQSLGMTIETPTFFVNSLPTKNLIATKTGTLYPDEFIVVGGHFDSRGTNGVAPGAEDNGSGTAAVLEIAKILAPVDCTRTIKFISFSGEEQGLIGSLRYVDSLGPTQRAGFKGALIMDMIAFDGDAQHELVLATKTQGTWLREELRAAAIEFTDMSVLNSTITGSDHTPFLNSNLPAVLSIEGDWTIYPGYHRSSDTTAFINREYGAKITKVNLAVAARLANPYRFSAASENWSMME